MLYREQCYIDMSIFPFPWKIQICLIQIVKFTRIGIAPPPGKNYLSIPPPWKKDILDSRMYTRTLSIVLLDGLISIIACRVTITYITCTVVYSILKGQITLTARKENLEHCKNCLIFSSTTLIYSFQFKMLDSFGFLYCSRP